MSGGQIRTHENCKKFKGFKISHYKIKHRKDTILRNCVLPKLGLHILNSSIKLNSEEEVKTCSTRHDIPPKPKDSGILSNFT